MNELLEKLLKMAHEWEVKTGYDCCSGASSARQDCVNELRDVVQSFQHSVQSDASTTEAFVDGQESL